HVDLLAAEGCTYSNFYVPQSVCSASRASLLTGCYPERTGVASFYYPKERGLDPSFVTIGEMLQENGYKTACFGKWHIGDKPETHPYARGFDETAGIMYSNDMWKYHPVPEEAERYKNLPLNFYENDKILVKDMGPEEQKNLTNWITDYSLDFIERNAKNPFFLYVPHPMPHVPIFCSEEFEGKSGEGLYADVIMELDWSIGQIVNALKENGLENNTMVILTSDNGPWTTYGNHAGYTPFSMAKATSFDGGTRSACIIKYPAEIEAGSKSDKAFCSIDFMPVLAHLSNAVLPDYKIDGKNVWDLITSTPGAVNPHDYYAFTINQDFQAIMTGDGRWKLHLPHEYRVLDIAGRNGKPGKYRQEEIGFSLFDLEKDPFETTNVIDQYPETKEKLMNYVDAHRERFFVVNEQED
ncbi:MAG: sulfatase-like hydrolase/transferase, partial [bacterium]